MATSTGGPTAPTRQATAHSATRWSLFQCDRLAGTPHSTGWRAGLPQGKGTAWALSRSCIVAGVSDKKPQTRGAAGKARVKRGMDKVRRGTADAQAAAAPTAQKTVQVVGKGASAAGRWLRNAGQAASKASSAALEGVVQRARSAVGETNESAMRFLATRYRDSRFVRRAGGGATLALWPALDAPWLKDLLQAAATVSTPTAWDRAMDAVYNAGREHGNLHRLFDEGHSITGALQAGREAVPDANWIENLGGTLSAIWRDSVTPQGMPFVTLSRDWYNEATSVVSDLADRGLPVPSDFVRDWVTWDATEFVTSSLGAVIVVFQFKEDKAVQLARTAGSLGLVGAASANPLAVVVSGVALARSIQVRGTAKTGEEALRGAVVSAAAIGGGKLAAAAGLGSIASGLVAPIAVGVGASVVIGMLADQWRRGALDRRQERELRLFDAVGLA